MPGERWPDKRARAVLFAGANKRKNEGADVDPDAVADLGLAVRELLFVDKEVREENADVKAHRIGYSADCMQFAILEPAADGVRLGLWVGNEASSNARAALHADDDPNPFRKMYGWVRVPVTGPDEVPRLSEWVKRARSHASQVKQQQAQTAKRSM